MLVKVTLCAPINLFNSDTEQLMRREGNIERILLSEDDWSSVPVAQIVNCFLKFFSLESEKSAVVCMSFPEGHLCVDDCNSRVWFFW